MQIKHAILSLLGPLVVNLPLAVTADAPPTPYFALADIGTFNLSSLNATDARNTAILTRQEAELLPNRTTQVRHGSNLRHLVRGKEISFSTTANGTTHNISSFMYHFGMAGVIIIKDGEIRLEKYQYGNEPSFRNQVQSVTKAFLSTALAAAVAKKDFLERSVPLQNLIDMTSGVVEHNSTSNPDLFNDIYPRTDPEAVLGWFKTFEKVAELGQIFNYYNPNYYVLSLSLSRALGEPIQDWVTKTIWGPAGMKYDGYMRVTGAGQVDGHGGLALTLQDMARFGLFVLDVFIGGGGPRVPDRWFQDISAASTSTGVRAPGAIDIVPHSGYQTGWWTMPRGGKQYQLGDDGGFAALGTYDQAIYIIPGMNTIIAMQSSCPVHYPDLFWYGQQFAIAASLALKKEHEC